MVLIFSGILRMSFFKKLRLPRIGSYMEISKTEFPGYMNNVEEQYIRQSTMVKKTDKNSTFLQKQLHILDKQGRNQED